MNIHLKIQELRKKNGFSQEDLAEKLGVSRQAVSKWESSSSTPDIDKILQLSKIFSVSVSELITGERDETASASPTQAAGDEKYEELLESHLMQIDRMLKAAQPPKKTGRRIFFSALALLSALYFIIYYADKMQRLENNISNLQMNMSGIRYDISSQIGSIQNEIYESLKKEYGLISDFSIDHRDIDFALRTVVLDISALPREWTKGSSAKFVIDSEGTETAVDCAYENGTITASATVPLTNFINVSAVIKDGDITKQEKLGDVTDLLNLCILQVDTDGFIRSTRTMGDNKLTMSGSVMLFVQQYFSDKTNRPSYVDSAILEITENGKVTETVDLKNHICLQGEDGFSDYTYDIESMVRYVNPGDTFDFIVTVTDSNGVVYKSLAESIVIGDSLDAVHNKNTTRETEIIMPEPEKPVQPGS